jgi:hypothetical protein
MVGLDVDGVMDILSKRVMRLDLKKINTPGYNEMVSKQGRVKSNVSPSQHTFNSNIEMNLNDVTVTPQLTTAETFEALGLTVPQAQPAPTTTTQQSSDTTTAPTTEGTVEVPVNDMTIVYNPQTGEMTFKTSGNPVTKETVVNKALVRYETQQGTIRTATYNNIEYKILSDNRIISMSKSNTGKEKWIKDSKQRTNILEQAGEVPTPTQPTTPTTEETTTAPDVDPFDLDIDLDSDKTDDTRTREVNENIEYEEWNQEEELAWFKENYPDVPVEVLDDIREVVGNGGPDAHRS